jgi:hypothetical protein
LSTLRECFFVEKAEGEGRRRRAEGRREKGKQKVEGKGRRQKGKAEGRRERAVAMFQPIDLN